MILETERDNTPSFFARIGRQLSRRGKGFRLLAGLVIVALCAWGLVAWRQRAATRNQGQTFRLVRVSRGPIQVTVSGSGTLRPAKRWELAAKTGSTVKRVLVEAGQTAKKGQVLVELDADEAVLKVEDAEIQFEQARSTLADLERNVESLFVKSEAGGSLTGFSVREGQVLPENYLIGTVTSPHMEVRAYFNGSQVKNIRPGQKASVFFPSLLCSIGGTVKHVSQSGKADARGAVLFPVVIEIENPGALVAGMAATVEVQTPAGVTQSPEETREVSHVVTEVRTKVSGTVRKVLVSDGDYVDPGQLLLELENESLRRQLESQMLKVRQAENQLAQAREQLSSCTVTAPDDSTVLAVNVSEGDQVGSGSVLAVLGDLSALEVTVQVDELDVAKVKAGQAASVTCDALPGVEIAGTVSSVGLEGKTSGGIATFEVKVRVMDLPAGLLPGMTCEVRIVTGSGDNVLLLPVEALLRQGDGYVVWAVSGTSEPATESPAGRARATTNVDTSILSQAKPVQVQVGLMNSTQAEILSGLTESDLVVVFGTSSGTSLPAAQWFQRGLQSPGAPGAIPR